MVQSRTRSAHSGKGHNQTTHRDHTSRHRTAHPWRMRIPQDTHSQWSHCRLQNRKRLSILAYPHISQQGTRYMVVRRPVHSILDYTECQPRRGTLETGVGTVREVWALKLQVQSKMKGVYV